MTVTQEICCGSLAGVVSQAVCHPIDTMRTRLQTGNFNGLRHCVTTTITQEGVSGFYRGLSAPLGAQAVYKAVIFSVNGATRKFITSNDLAPSGWVVPISGGIAGAANAAVVTPVELVRNRLQMQYAGVNGTQSAQYRGPIDVVKHVVRTRGFSGMYTGYLPTVMRDGPGMALFFLAFDAAKRGMLGSGFVDRMELPHVVLAACCSGISFWSWALPVDTVKSMVQSPGQEGKSLLRVVGDMYSSGGMPRFFRGWQAAFVRGIPGATSTLVTYTYLSEAWQNQVD